MSEKIILLLGIMLVFVHCSESENYNSVPVAFAGFDRTVIVDLNRSEVELDGTGSYDPDNDIIEYRWQLEHKPSKSSLAEIRNSDKPIATFIPDVEGEYVFSLLVNDGIFVSLKDFVVITVVSR